MMQHSQAQKKAMMAAIKNKRSESLGSDSGELGAREDDGDVAPPSSLNAKNLGSDTRDALHQNVNAESMRDGFGEHGTQDKHLDDAAGHVDETSFVGMSKPKDANIHRMVASDGTQVQGDGHGVDEQKEIRSQGRDLTKSNLNKNASLKAKVQRAEGSALKVDDSDPGTGDEVPENPGKSLNNVQPALNKSAKSVLSAGGNMDKDDDGGLAPSQPKLSGFKKANAAVDRKYSKK